jgi:hypothetical protein
MRALLFASTLLLCTAVSSGAQARKHKQAVVRSNPGGASQRWSCEQIAESACDVAKRCEPDRSLRHCRKLRDRCGKVKERNSHTSTEDDVTVCAQAVADLSCKTVSFDNASGVNFELKRIESCATVSKDNPLPATAGAATENKDAKEPRTGSAPDADADADDAP